jgi:hypothetical protein
MHGMMEQAGLIDMKELSQISAMDRLELEVGNLPQVQCPLEHFFTPEIYTRKIFMPAGSVVVSLKHKTTHPFFILKGKVAVLKETDGGVFEREALYEAGDMGITKPGTKRFLYNLEDTIWVTCHSNIDNIQDPDEMVLKLSEPNENPLIDTSKPEFSMWKKDVSPSLIHKELQLA